MLRRLAFGLILSSISTACALAADLGVGPAHSLKDQPAPVSRPLWTGLYFGVNGGYGWGDGKGDLVVLNPSGTPYATGPLPYDLDSEGGFAGLQVGYNRQWGGLVFGIEADIQWSGIDGSSVTSFAPPNVSPFNYTATLDLQWFSTVRGRLGFAWDRTLLYVTAGAAFGEIDYRGRYFIPGNAAFGNLSSEETKTGYVLGAGLEHMLDPRWSLKVEYQFMDLGDGSANGALHFADGRPSGEPVRTHVETEFHTIRIGLNYRFN